MDAVTGVKVMRLSTICTFGGVGAIGAGIHLFTSGEPAAAGILAALGVAALGLVAWAYGVRPPERVRSGTRRAAAPAFAGLLVLSVVLSGPAMGALGFQDCDVSDSLVAAGIQSLIGANDPGECRFNPDDGSYENVTQTDVYAMGLAMRDSEDAYLTTRSNMAADVEGVMWMQAKVEIIEALNNGASKSYAKRAAKEEVENYTSVIAHNHLQEASNRAHQLAYMANQTGATASTNQSTHVSGGTTGQNGLYASTANVTFTLPNGTNATYAAPVYKDGLGDTKVMFAINASMSNVTWVNSTWSEGNLTEPSPAGYEIHVENATEAKSVVAYGIDDGVYRQSYLENFTDAQNQVKANVDAYVDEVYASYTSGDIDTTDLWDPITLAQEASTEYDSTGFYAFANSELAALGLGGDTNASHVVQTTWTNVSYDGGEKSTVDEQVNITGTLFVANPDSNLSLETGTAYDPAAINGTVYMTVASMENTTTGNATGYNSSMFEVTSTFTIVEATNTKTGEEINTTTVEDTEYETQDTSRLGEEVDRLMELRQEYENQQTTGGGGGWNLDLGGTQTGALLALAAVVALFVLKD